MSDDAEWMTCRTADLSAAIEKAITPLVMESAVVKEVCQQALDLARDRTQVLEITHAQNVDLRTALIRLLEDTQHAKHNCGDSIEDCPVAFARFVLRGLVKQ